MSLAPLAASVRQTGSEEPGSAAKKLTGDLTGSRVCGRMPLVRGRGVEANILACQAKDRGFKSRRPRLK